MFPRFVQNVLSPSEELEIGVNHHDSPERALRKAILDRALYDYLAVTHTERHIEREAEAWIFLPSSAPKRWPFTFLRICQDLDLDPEFLRTCLKYGKERFRGELIKNPNALPETLGVISRDVREAKRTKAPLSLCE